jgi:hypothetical protein
MWTTYISALTGTDSNRIYIGSDGNIYETSGGSRSWRNNNPGNIEDGKFARNNGAIGSDGRFAIFPDQDIGWNAMVKLLSSPAYQTLTIEKAINRYAPPNENNVDAYLKSVESQTGFLRSTPMDNLSQDNLLQLAKAVRKHEGDKLGKTRLVRRDEKYIWKTVGDNRVRPEHKLLDGQERYWYDTPHPGEEFGCRCRALPID